MTILQVFTDLDAITVLPYTAIDLVSGRHTSWQATIHETLRSPLLYKTHTVNHLVTHYGTANYIYYLNNEPISFKDLQQLYPEYLL